MLTKTKLILFRFSKQIQNYYKLLNVQQESPLQQIKQRYLEESKKWHPDSETGDAEKFIKYQNAFKVLSNPNKRRMHDRALGIDVSLWQQSEYALKDSSFQNEQFQQILTEKSKREGKKSVEEILFDRNKQKMQKKLSISDFVKCCWLPFTGFLLFYMIWQLGFILATSKRETKTYSSKISQQGKSLSIIVTEMR